MTLPRRLLDGDGDELERALLGSAAGDAPSRRASQRALAALGIGGGLVLSGTSATTASAAAQAAAQVATTGAVGTATALGGQAGLGVLVKWVGVATVGGIAALGVVDQATEPQQPSEPAHVVMAPVAEICAAAQVTRRSELGAVRPTSPPTDEGGESLDSAAAMAQPGAPGEEAVAAAPTSRHAAGADEVDAGLGAEVEALDRARSALQAGRSSAALQALGAYRREFPAGALRPEAELLYIEALMGAGRSREAQAAAQAFLERYPASPLARRARSLLGRTTGATDGR